MVGGLNRASAEKACDLYRRFVEGEIALTDADTAEMVKLIENTFRDVNIALANELAAICEQAGIDAWEAVELANRHPRVNVHKPGPGVGGHCISVDPWFIIGAFREEARLIALGRAINAEQPAAVARRVLALVEEMADPVVTILGVAYKGNIDDTRESPALPVIAALEAAGVTVKIYDPHVTSFPYETKSLKEAFTGSDCALVLADHDEFRFLYPKEPAALMRTRLIYDTRNCLDRNLWQQYGFQYHLLGLSRGRGC